MALAEHCGLPVEFATDASVALFGALALFLAPNGKGERLLDWNAAQQIPWGVLILFAGGLCMASAFKASGLSEILGNGLAGLGHLPTLLLIACICFGVTFLTEVTSNTATTTLLLPILGTAAISASIEPKILMVPATISASFAFMLPVATPPNAIIFGSGMFTVRDMAREGLALNLVGVPVVTLICYFMFGSQ
jgi:sodium-dependent dicarboxylate transporter 2/3/5